MLKTGGGEDQPKEKREKEWIRRGLKQGAGRANLWKKEKTIGLVGAKNRGQAGLFMEKRKTNGLVGAKNRQRLVQPKEKRENKWISRG